MKTAKKTISTSNKGIKAFMAIVNGDKLSKASKVNDKVETKKIPILSFDELVEMTDTEDLDNLFTQRAMFHELAKRMDAKIAEMKTKESKKRKVETTRAQQVLLLKYLGLLDIVKDLKIGIEKEAKLLAYILNKTSESIEKDIRIIENVENSKLATQENYEFLFKVFKENGLEEKANQMEIILDKVNKKKNRKKAVTSQPTS